MLFRSFESIDETRKHALRDRVIQRLRTPKADNIFYLRHALRLGVTVDELYEITKIDRWFLFNIKQIVEMEQELAGYAA